MCRSVPSCNLRWFPCCNQALAGHDNIIRLQHVIKAENDRDIYLTFDHMGKCGIPGVCVAV